MAVSRSAIPVGTLAYAALALAAAALAGAVPLSGYVLNVLMQATTYAISVIGLTIVLGLCGQINLAQAAFFGIGAYAVGLGTTAWGLDFWVSLGLGLGTALVLGGILGASTLRLGGHYLAMVTISFQQILTLVLVNWIPVTRGPDGVPGILRPSYLAYGQRYLALCVLILAVVAYAVWRMPDTRLGRAMRAVRDNELAAGVSGVNVYRTKILAFAIGALLAGLGGGLFAGGFAYVSPDQFTFAESVVFLTMALLGGVGSPVGAVIGTGLLVLLPEWLRFLKEIPGLYLALYGLAVILIIIFMPVGIWGFVSARLGRLGRRTGIAGSGGDLVLTQRPPTAHPVLEVVGLAKHFGGLKAVDEIGFGGGARRCPRAYRPERLRQDDDVESAVRDLRPDRGAHPARRSRRDRLGAARPRGGRARPHLPEHQAVPLHDGARERRGRGREAGQPGRPSGRCSAGGAGPGRPGLRRP